MSFGKIFDGYCVIHAEHCTGKRLQWFERELKRVGVNDYKSDEFLSIIFKKLLRGRMC